MEVNQIYEFGPMRLDPAERLLLHDGKPVPLAPKAFDLLVILVENHGHLLSKEDLMRRLWPDTFVEEVNLAQNVSAIRRALGDDRDGQQYIETVPKIGYRFRGQVRHDPDRADEDAAPVGRHSPAQNGRGKRVRLYAVAFSAAILVFGALWFARNRATPGADANRKVQVRSIAVLPFVNLSSDPAQEYFSAGLTDELITHLAQVGSLRVISRTSVMGYKGSMKKAPEIGRELNVDALVEGSLERAQDRVRIRIQLINTANDQHLWARSYDRDLKDILRLESEIAGEIAQQIGYATQLGSRAARNPAPRAFENYLKGRYRWNQRTEAGLRAAIRHFQVAIEADPTFAPAYAGLADCYIIMANWGFMPGADAYPRAISAARSALALEPNLAEAHTSLAYATFLHDWDWAGAERGFQRAITLEPNYATAHHFYSIYLMAAGRHADAITEIHRARDLDPLSPIINSVVGWIHYEARQYPEGIREGEKAVAMDPNYVPALTNLGVIYMRTGQYKRSIEYFERAHILAGQQGVVLSYLAQAHSLAGDKARARKILQDFDRKASYVVSPWDRALVYVALGEKENALAALELAADQRVGWIVRLGVDPALDTLRGEPRFLALERRIGIPAGARLLR